MSEEVGFKPTRRCPVCKELHEVKYQYKGVDILVCPKMTGDKMVLMDEGYANDELQRLSEMQRFVVKGVG